MSAFSFYDLSKTSPEVYEMTSQGLAKAVAADPEKKVAFTLPPLEKLKPHLGAALDVYWSDEAGWHSKGVGPFPLSNVLSPNGVLMMGGMRQAGEAMKARGGAKAGDGMP